jgi:hypothetical protein
VLPDCFADDPLHAAAATIVSAMNALRTRRG